MSKSFIFKNKTLYLKINLDVDLVGHFKGTVILLLKTT